VGSVFGGTDGRRFEILKEAGRGGQAVVFKAMDTRLSRPLALKLCVAPDGAARRLFMERFERELKLTSRLNHPHVLQLYDCGELPGGFPYVMLEWMEHGSLSGLVELLRGQGRNLPMAYAAYYGRAVSAALHAVHAADVVHRDVKPDNVLIGRDGVAKLTDFGIAKDLAPDAPKLTEMGLTLGTPGFMAPEQLAGLPGPVSDVFSFGVTLYVLLTGRLPDQEVSANRIPLGILKHEAFGLLPQSAVAMIRTLTAFEVEDRPQSFKEVLHLLERGDWSEVDRPVPGRRELPPLPSGVFVSGSTSVLEVDTLVADQGVGVVTGAPTVGPGADTSYDPSTIGFEDTMDLTVGEVKAEAPSEALVPGPTRPFPPQTSPGPGPDDVGPTRPMTVRPPDPPPEPPSEDVGPARSTVPQPPEAAAAGGRSRRPLLIALVLAAAAVVAAAALWPCPVPSEAELLEVYAAVEAAAAEGDWPAAAEQIEQLPEAALEGDAGKLLAGLDAYLAGDLAGARSLVDPLTGSAGVLGARASLLLAAAARVDGEGDYDAAAQALAAAADCSGAGCEPLVARARRGLAEVCAVSTAPACDQVQGPEDHDRALAASVVLLGDGHGSRARAALTLGLAAPTDAPPSCLQVASLRVWSADPGPLEESLRALLADAARRAARAPSDCALFQEGP